MIEQDPFAYRRLFNLSMSYGAVVFLLLCSGPVRDFLSEPATVDRVRETAGAIGALVPAGMAVSAVVAGVVRKILFHCGGVNRRSLWAVFLAGTFWHLPFTLLVARAAAEHEPAAWTLPLRFTLVGLVASAALVFTLRLAFRRHG